MPTPRDSATQLQLAIDPHLDRATHATCPTENERPGAWKDDQDMGPDSDDIVDGLVSNQHDAPPSDTDIMSPVESINDELTRSNASTMNEEKSHHEGSSPISISSDSKDAESRTTPTSISSSLSVGIPNIRVC